MKDARGCVLKRLENKTIYIKPWNSSVWVCECRAAKLWLVSLSSISFGLGDIYIFFFIPCHFSSVSKIVRVVTCRVYIAWWCLCFVIMFVKATCWEVMFVMFVRVNVWWELFLLFCFNPIRACVMVCVG